MSLLNKKVVEFNLEAFQENKFIKVSNKDLIGKWSVLFFYPADFTFVCPTELEDLANYYHEFQAIDCEIYGVSCDTHFVHKAWHETSPAISKVNYPMIGDPTGILAKDLEIYDDLSGMSDRGTFIINPNGEVMMYEVSSGSVGRSAVELYRKIEAAKFTFENGGEACPANWKPGSKALTPGYDLVGKI